jgi:hypothetical protein
MEPLELGMPSTEPLLAIGGGDAQVFVFEQSQRKAGRERSDVIVNGAAGVLAQAADRQIT